MSDIEDIENTVSSEPDSMYIEDNTLSDLGIDNLDISDGLMQSVYNSFVRQRTESTYIPVRKTSISDDSNSSESNSIKIKNDKKIVELEIETDTESDIDRKIKMKKIGIVSASTLLLIGGCAFISSYK